MKEYSIETQKAFNFYLEYSAANLLVLALYNLLDEADLKHPSDKEGEFISSTAVLIGLLRHAFAHNPVMPRFLVTSKYYKK